MGTGVVTGMLCALVVGVVEIFSEGIKERPEGVKASREEGWPGAQSTTLIGIKVVARGGDVFGSLKAFDMLTGT